MFGAKFYPSCKVCEAIRLDLDRVKGNPSGVEEMMYVYRYHMRKMHGVHISDEDSGLSGIPMVGYRRARFIAELGVTNIREVAAIDPAKFCERPEVKASSDTSLPSALSLVVNYAQAICTKRPIVTGTHPAFCESPERLYFMDLEYDPQGTASRRRVGIFLYGILDSHGNVIQRFLDDPSDEEELIEWFSDWLVKEAPALATYSSKSADEPHLRNSLRKFELSTDCLSKARFLDLFYDVIFTQSPKTQKIFLPISGSISSKRVAYYFGYREAKSVRIHDGLEALAAYEEYLRNRSKRIRNDLLAYNRCDLERTSLIYSRLRQLFDKHRKKETPPMHGRRR